MDLEERRIYREEEHCGHGVLALSAISMAFLPSLGGSAAAHLAGLVPITVGAPLVNAVVDRLFRDPR